MEDEQRVPGTLASVHHDGSARYVRRADGGRAARLALGDVVLVRVRAAPEAPIRRVILRMAPDGEQALAELVEAGREPACRWWEGEIRLAMPTTGYRFVVVTDDGEWWLTGRGLSRAVPTDADDFRLLADYAGPSWLPDRVFYQVFPDRFANGDPSNDVRDGAWTYRGAVARRRAWDELPATSGSAALVEFFGGDLAGIETRLDDLADLGVNALYLTPVFDARSNHGYDCIDYDHVAPHFGRDEALASLRRATAERDLRLVLDIAPNHCGAEHPWFVAARHDPAAPTAGYFTFRSHPDEYESWLGVRALAKLNYASPGLRAAIYAGPEAVMRHWLRPPYSIDGWRIDVANMLARQGPDQLAEEVGRGIRSAVREENPDAYLVGEHWFDATDQLRGDRWDGVMNYAGFATPLWAWLAGPRLRAHGSSILVHGQPTPTSALVDTWAAFRAAVPWAIACQQYLLVGSHDTPRIRSVVGDDPGLVRLALGVLLTYPGVPGLYYGDEIGLAGTTELAARRPMIWDGLGRDEELRSFVRALVHLRRDSSALRDGGLQVLAAEADTLAYLRDVDGELVIVVAHRGPVARPAGGLPVRHGGVADGIRFTDVVSGARADVTGGRLSLPSMPAGIAIWRAITA